MFARRLTIVFLLVLIIAFAAGSFFDYRYRQRWRWLVFDKMEVALSDPQDYDILLLGNSRIHTGVNPYYLDSITGLKSYNLAIGAGDEQEMKLMSTVYLDHHKAPAFVVIGLDNSMLVKYNILRERFGYLFYLDNDSIRSFMQRNGFPTTLIRYLPFFKYSFLDEYNRSSLFTRSPVIPRFDHNIYKGFINVFPGAGPDSVDRKAQNPVTANELPTAKNINDTAAATIVQTIELYKSRGSRILLVFPPVRDEVDAKTNKFQSWFLELSAEYQIPLLRTDTSIEYKPYHYIDKGHLNERGSRIFSRQVGLYINQLRKVNTN